MTIQIQMTVQESDVTPMEVAVDYQGESTKGVIQAMEITLTTLDGLHGSLTLRFTKQSDIDEARRVFVKGSTVTLVTAG